MFFSVLFKKCYSVYFINGNLYDISKKKFNQNITYIDTSHLHTILNNELTSNLNDANSKMQIL